MAGYIGTKAVSLSTTAADVTGDAEIGGDLTVSGALTSTGIDDNATSTAITIDSSENVGIGTSSPDVALKVYSATDAAHIDIDGPAAINRGLEFSSDGDRRWYIYENSAAEAGGNSGSDFSITRYSDGGGYAGVPFHINRSTGNVGINSVQDLELPLNVSTKYSYQGLNNGAIKICHYSSHFSDSAPQGVIENIGYTGVWYGSRYHASGNRVLDGAATQSSGINMHQDSLRFYTTPTLSAGGTLFSHSYERMRITSNGSLLIGTTVENATLTLQGNVATSYSAYLSGSASGSGYNLLCRGYTTTGVAVRFLNSAGSDCGSIDYTATSTSYTTSSDYRLKTDAQPMTGASARVQALNPVNFEWIADGTRVDGFLAHEAQAVVPEAVTGTKDAMRDEEYEVTPAVEATYDEDGNVLTEAIPAVMGTRSVPAYQGIDQSKLVPLLTAALQEALTKIDDLETRLTALEGN